MPVSDREKKSPLYRRVVKDAKAKFDVYPSRWAGTWISQEYKKRSSKRRHGGSKRRTTISKKRYVIPAGVQNAAKRALDLKKQGFAGGTDTGHRRARQLARGGDISQRDLITMRAWFARHKYTSKPGYEKWVKAGRPRDDSYFKSHGSVYAWLSWGGDAGERWVNRLNLDT